MVTRTALTPTVEIGGKKDVIPEGKLLSVTVRQAVGTADVAEVLVDDDEFELFDKGTVEIGKDLEVKFQSSDAKFVSVFKGPITSVGIRADADSGGIARLAIQARDRTHQLALASEFTTYLKQSVGDVVKAIAGRHSLTAKVWPELPTVKEDYRVQWTTDHAFLTELARLHGCEWYLDGKELHFRPRPKSPKGPTLRRSDQSLQEFRAEFTGVNVPKKVEVHGFDPKTQKAYKGAAKQQVLDGKEGESGTSAKFVHDGWKAGAKAFGKPLAVADHATRDAKEAEAVASGLAREMVSAGLNVQGIAWGEPEIKAGEAVEIEEMGTRLSGTYYVSQVVHEFRPEQDLRTHFTCGPQHAPPPPWLATGNGSGTADWASRGPVTAVVTNLQDPEKLGRIKVKFPSLGDVESDWAYVLTQGAGTGRGIDFRPQVNDVVLVLFERGDPRFPVVLGSLWTKKGDHPTAGIKEDNGSLADMAVTSRAGHALTFSDGGAKAKAGDKDRRITLACGDGETFIELNEDKKKGVVIEAPQDGNLTLRAGMSELKLDDKGNITIKTKKGTFTIEAPKLVKVESKQKVEVTAVQGVKLEAKAGKFEAAGLQAEVAGKTTLDLKGPASVKIN